MTLEKQLMYLPLGDTWDLFNKIHHLADFAYHCFNQSSRKDQLIEVVREGIATGIWQACLQDFNNLNWSDGERLTALELLVPALGFPYDDVLDCSLLLPKPHS